MTASGNKIYWLCQFLGWAFYSVLNLVFFSLSAEVGWRDYLVYLFLLPSGITISHFSRTLIKKWKALDLNLYYQALYIIVSSLLKGSVLYLFLVSYTIFFKLSNQEITFLNAVSGVINFSVIFFVWNIIYFGYHYFVNYKEAEINNLRLESAGKESELNSLKAQLNPHFMFNSLNSIRALIDENAPRAKEAITRLSNILRNSLLMNKNREITLEEELNLVRDYLELEKIRYEERLRFCIETEASLLSKRLPPLIIQSQVENAIKHGISKLPEGGEVSIKTTNDTKFLKIQITNTGLLRKEKPETGLGYQNSLQRLQLMYGSNASLAIFENKEQTTVTTEIIIPLN